MNQPQSLGAVPSCINRSTLGFNRLCLDVVDKYCLTDISRRTSSTGWSWHCTYPAMKIQGLTTNLSSTRAARVAILYNDHNYFPRDMYHNLWMVDDVRAGDHRILAHAMQIRRPRPRILEDYPYFSTHPCRGLNLMESWGGIHILNIPCKDALVLPDSCCSFIGASMEYDYSIQKYKIIRRLPRKTWLGGTSWSDEYPYYKFQMYTLNSDATWVDVEPPLPSQQVEHGFCVDVPVFANGAHHWLDLLLGKDEYLCRVVALEANTGRYKVMPLKPHGVADEILRPSIFLDRDSGNVCVMVILDHDRRTEMQYKPTERDHMKTEDCPVELWILKVEDGVDALNGNLVWEKRWEGFLPRAAATPFWMESQKLFIQINGSNLAWYDFSNHELQIIVHEKAWDDLEAYKNANRDIREHNWPYDFGIGLSVSIYDETFTPSSLLQDERKIIASTSHV